MFGRYVLTIDDDDTIPASPAPDTDKVYRRFLLSQTRNLRFQGKKGKRKRLAAPMEVKKKKEKGEKKRNGSGGDDDEMALDPSFQLDLDMQEDDFPRKSWIPLP